MRVILTILEGAPSDSAVLRLARLAARDADAHLDVLSSLPDPRDAIPVMGEGLSGDVVERLMAEATAEIERQRTQARAAYDELAGADDLRALDAPDGQPGSSISWREMTGRASNLVPIEGRLADLIVVARAESARTDRGTVEATVFGSGRPVLMAPPAPVVSLATSVTIFWNGSAEASRAVAAALPYLRRAEHVRVFALDENLGPESAQTGLARYLSWHGVQAQTRMIKPDHRDPGAALLEEAQKDGSDLVVMGAYTHSRLRQMILGGVTSHILEHAPLPILMCH